MAKFTFRRVGGLPKALPAERPITGVTAPDAAPVNPVGLFKMPANSQLWRTAKQPPSYAGEVTKLCRDVFTPSQPKRTIGEFIGRAETIARITQSIEEEQAHILLLGRRSLGKSSILNVIAEAARQAGFLVAHIPCTADLTFKAFLHAIFEEFSAHLAEAPAGEVFTRQIGVERLSDLIDPAAADVQSALQAFSRMSPQKVLVLIDDFHRVRDVATKRRLCDLLAALTGSGASVSMVIAAREDRSDCFGFDHGEEPSGTVAIVLDAMRPDEISEMLLNGGSRLGVRFDEDVLQSIVLLAQGSPAIAQWMGLLTVRRVLRRYEDAVTMADVVAAAQDAAVKADRYTCMLLDNALLTRGGDLEKILCLAARTPHGPQGLFSPTGINREAAYMGAPPFPERKLHRLLTRHSSGADAIFEKLATAAGPGYRFTDPLTRAIVLLRNVHREKPSDTEVLNAYLQHQSQPRSKPDANDEFGLWVRFVLTPEDAALFRRWAEQDPMGLHDLRKCYRQARDEHDLEILLRNIQAKLAGGADPNAPHIATGGAR